ncbi:MAG: DUF5667 domain-containing protein [Patescibacteria group bacterium]
MEKLFAKIKKERLGADEKAEIFSNLKNFVNENPIQKIKSPYSNPWQIFLEHKTFATTVASAILIVSLTGSTVLAAKNSLPGDKLYPIKMLDEKVQSFTTIGAEAQAEIHASQAISRLQEVEQMVTKKIPLDIETKKEIQNNFGNQTREMENHINKLKDSGDNKKAEKIQSDFESSISEHKKAIIELSNIEDKKSENHQGEVKGAQNAKENNSKKNTEKNQKNND